MKFFETVRQTFCWHEDLLKYDAESIYLECHKCHRKTAGWSLKKEVFKAAVVTGVIVGIVAWFMRRKTMWKKGMAGDQRTFCHECRLVVAPGADQMRLKGKVFHEGVSQRCYTKWHAQRIQRIKDRIQRRARERRQDEQGG